MRFQPGPCTIVPVKEHELDWPEFTATKTVNPDGTLTINTPIAVNAPIVAPRARTASTGYLVTNAELTIKTRPLATDPDDDSGAILVADNNEGCQLFYDPEDDTWWVTAEKELTKLWRHHWSSTPHTYLEVIAPAHYDADTHTETADLKLYFSQTDLPEEFFTPAPLKQEDCRTYRTETPVITCGEQLTNFITEQLQDRCNNRRIIGTTITDRCHTPQAHITNAERYVFPYADTYSTRFASIHDTRYSHDETELATLRLDDPQLPWNVYRSDLLPGNDRATVAADLTAEAKENIATIEACLLTEETNETWYNRKQQAEELLNRAVTLAEASRRLTEPSYPKYT